MVPSAEISPHSSSRANFLLFLLHIILFQIRLEGKKKIGIMAERLEKLQVEMEGPKNQNMAKIEDQRVTLLMFLRVESCLCNWKNCG